MRVPGEGVNGSGELCASGKAVWTPVVAVDAGSMQIQWCEGREAVAEIVESESLPRLKLDADFNRSGANLIFACLRSGAFYPSSFSKGKTQSSGFA